MRMAPDNSKSDITIVMLRGSNDRVDKDGNQSTKGRTNNAFLGLNMQLDWFYTEYKSRGRNMKIVNSGVLQKLNSRNWADPWCTGNWEVTKYWNQIQLEIEDKLTSPFRDDDDYEMILRHTAEKRDYRFWDQMYIQMSFGFKCIVIIDGYYESNFFQFSILIEDE